MSLQTDIERHILASYNLIREYQDVIRISDRPQEKARAESEIDQQWRLIHGYVKDYAQLIKTLHIIVPANINEILALITVRSPNSLGPIEILHKTELKMRTKEFNVFLAHNSLDKVQVSELANELKRRGLKPWIDSEQIAPGRLFQDVIQQAIPNVESAAIIIGPQGIGAWEEVELRSFISQCVRNKTPVIPVLLPGINRVPDQFLFLQEYGWVRFENSVHEEESLDNFEWGITGKHPKR